MMNKIYAIIVTYNAMQRGWIDRCMKSLAESTIPVVPIIVDNGSTDGTRDYVPATYPDVIWLPQERNLGFGQANNVGMRYALQNEADYVLLLNQDAALQPTAMEEMLKVSDGFNLITPIHLCGDGSRIDTMFRESLKRADNQLLDDIILKKECNDRYDIGEVCAACWLIPVSILEVVGGFSPLFFQYGEDNNYYTRLIYHGRKTVLSAKSFMWHDRKIHGNEKLWNQKYIPLRALIIACDPNLSFARRLRKWIGIWIEAPFRFPWEFLKLLPKLHIISKYNREEKIEQACWL